MCVIFLYPCDNCFIDMLKAFFLFNNIDLKESVHCEKLSTQINIHYLLVIVLLIFLGGLFLVLF